MTPVIPWIAECSSPTAAFASRRAPGTNSTCSTAVRVSIYSTGACLQGSKSSADSAWLLRSFPHGDFRTKENRIGLISFSSGGATSRRMARSALCRRVINIRWPTLIPLRSMGFPRAGSSCSARSEEHTSELQSHLNLVCRLLLEKKKQDLLHARGLYVP